MMVLLVQDIPEKTDWLTIPDAWGCSLYTFFPTPEQENFYQLFLEFGKHTGMMVLLVQDICTRKRLTDWAVFSGIFFSSNLKKGIWLIVLGILMNLLRHDIMQLHTVATWCQK